jgi:hypothetical protein
MSIPLPSPSMKFECSGFCPSSYCSTYSTSFGVIGPDHINPISQIVDTASSMIWYEQESPHLLSV